MNIQLLIVDPQNDFVVKDSGADIKAALMKKGMSQAEAEAVVNPYSHMGSLVVDGADADMKRLAAFINRVGPKLDDIHVTMDSHQSVGIERPTWWKNAKTGAQVAPFTVLGVDNGRIVEMRFSNGAFTPTDIEVTTVKPSRYARSRDYLLALAAGGKFPHVVWPVHCVVGTWGWSVVDPVADALGKWERDQSMRVNYVVKGNNPWTEHFGGLMAEVADPKDPTTQLNTGLVKTLKTADIIVLSGEALSHCVNTTVRQIADAFKDPVYIQKLVLLSDASSNVGGFEFLGKAFIDDLTKMGMQISTTVDFLA